MAKDELFKLKGKKLYIDTKALDLNKISDSMEGIRETKAFNHTILGLVLTGGGLVLHGAATGNEAETRGGFMLGGSMAVTPGIMINITLKKQREKLAELIHEEGWEGILRPEAHKEFVAKGLHKKFEPSQLRADVVGGVYRREKLKVKPAKEPI